MGNVPCAACGVPARPGPRALWKDPVIGGDFPLYSCPACGLDFALSPPGFPLQEWYRKAHHMYGELEYSVHSPASEDWRFARFLRAGLSGRLLDVGCGDGRFLALARQRGWQGELSGLDFNPEMAGRAGEGFSIEVASLEEFSARSEPHDAVTLFDVFEHFERPRETLELLRRLVKPGGRLALSVPNAERLLPWGWEEFDYPPHHFTRWSVKSLAGLLERSGFSVVETATTFCGPRQFSEPFFYQLWRGALPWAKRLLFGRQAAASGKTFGELSAAAPGALSDPGRRKRLETLCRRAFNAAAFLPLLPVSLIFPLLRPRAGAMLFVLARRTP